MLLKFYLLENQYFILNLLITSSLGPVANMHLFLQYPGDVGSE